MENTNTNSNYDEILNINLDENINHLLEHSTENKIEPESTQTQLDLKIEDNIIDKININDDKLNSNLESTEITESTPEKNKPEENHITNSNINSSLNTDSNLKFYENLRSVIKTQENILNMTGMASEKIKYANEISLDQLNKFQENSLEYGKYLKLIHEELQMIGDLMKKIKKEVKNQ
jgi:hypothetical protein